MSYQVLVTFDLKNATSVDYDNVYSDLAALGLERVKVGVATDGLPGQWVIPTTTVLGDGYGAFGASDLAVAIREKVSALFKARRLTSEIFVTAGRDGSWAVGTT